MHCRQSYCVHAERFEHPFTVSRSTVRAQGASLYTSSLTRNEVINFVVQFCPSRFACEHPYHMARRAEVIGTIGDLLTI